MRKIYIAARWGRGEEAKKCGEILAGMGHTITAKWLDLIVGDYYQKDDDYMQKWALEDLKNVADADLVISLIEPYGSMFKGGGRCVEFGYGYALGKELWIVGPNREQIFHYLPGVVRFNTFEEVLDVLS